MANDDTSGAPSVTVWVATGATYIKAAERFSGDLSEGDKVAIKTGARVRARIVSGEGNHWIVSDGDIDGEPLPTHLRFLYKPNWLVVATDVSSVGEETGTGEEIAPALSAEDRLRARSYDLWEQDGRPDNQADYYWFRAMAEVEGDE